jgi:hypothetical protein
MIKTANKGSVLILVLWIVMMLGVIAGFYGVDSRIRRISGRAELNDIQARLIVRSVLLYVNLKLSETKKYLNENQVDNLEISDNLLLPNGTVNILNISDRNVEFKLEDERGKLDINNSQEENLREVIRQFYMLKGDREGQKQADIVVDSILDWRDSDDNPRDNGAESEYYSSLEIPYSSPNRPFKTLEELMLVRGVTREAFLGSSLNNSSSETSFISAGLKDILTIYNYQGRVVSSVAPAVLAEIIENSEINNKEPELTGQNRLNILKNFDVLKLSVFLDSREYQVIFRYSELVSNIKILRWIESPPQGILQ